MDAYKALEIFISILLVFTGVMMVFSKDIIKTIIFLSILSMITAVAFVLLKAPDVAITEIVIGSGLITFLFLFTIKTSKKAGDTK